MKQLLTKMLLMTAVMTLSSCGGFIDAVIGVDDNPVSEKPTAPVTEEDSTTPAQPEPQTSTEAVAFSNEANLKSVINSVYLNVALTISYQQTLEAFRLKKIDAETFGALNINAENTTLLQTWNNAYEAIARANFIIKYLKDADFGYSTGSYLAEATALRSFAYYQLALLWGNVPLVTEESDPIESIPSTKNEDVLTYAYNQLNGVLDKFNSSNDAAHFNKISAQALMAEILLTIDRKDDAKALLSEIKNQAGDDVFHAHFISENLEKIPVSFVSKLNSTSDFCIYNKTYIDFLYKEASGDTEGLADTWYSSTHLYGIWAAMKRLGVAQEKTGCEGYELLMPIPMTEMIINPCITQNPGY